MEPIFFERNRVARVYTGGKLFGDFFGDEPVDGFFPEEWIASNVRAIHKGSNNLFEGLSKIKSTGEYFSSLLKKQEKALLGNQNYRVLIKVLDSAIRLPAQAHPDKAFSKKYFNSNYGKTECWYILNTRPGAKLYFGFKTGVTKTDFEAAVTASESDPTAMERLMNWVLPKKGQVYFVPAKTVHAIGKGCLILEVQEPTDFTIQPERFCGNYRLSDEEMYLGLSRETALKCFNFGPAPQPFIPPKNLVSTNTVTVQNLLGPQQTSCFVMNRIQLNNGEHTLLVPNSYAVYIVTSGFGQLIAKSYTHPLKKGDYFFMPAALMGKFKAFGSLEIIECY